MASLQLVRDVLAAAMRGGQIACDSYNYSASWTPLDASALNVPRSISIDADADFLIVYGIMAAYTTPGTVMPDPEFSVTILDTGSGRNYQNQPQLVTNIFGSARDPYIWPEPKLVAAASVLNLQLSNLTTTQCSRVDLLLAGLKIFYFRGFTRSQLGVWSAAA